MREKTKNPITFPFLCISYYASSKNEIDNKHSFDKKTMIGILQR